MEIVIRKKSAFKGLSLPENKVTAKKFIEVLPPPQKVTIPVQQSTGAPCEFIIDRGDLVKTGQKIADSDSYVSSPIHSPISGKVDKIIKLVNPVTSGLIDAAVIESDGKDSWVELAELFDMHKSEDFNSLKRIIESLDKKEILDMIREAGIVGLGGATFPTHVKLNPPPDKKIDTVILNGCECEPFITSDHRLMLENGREILIGLYIINNILSPQNIYIAIEDNKRDAINKLQELIVMMDFSNLFKIVSLKSRYPMGAEKSLIKTVTGRTVPMGGLPMDVGVIVNNVATSKAIYDAVIEGKPLIDRVVTVTGNVINPKNLQVRLGMSINSLIEKCGGFRGEINSVIAGGPMMGLSIVDVDFPITKGTNCVLVMKRRIQDEQNCINCGRCVNACPMNLMPLMFARYVKRGNFENCREYYIDNCIECGSCAYVCPANIPIVGYIKTGKSVLARKKADK
ncbi:MAG: electron transport complex subunit RsxC [Actinomycetota bacterium]|nr:electron transport complex subunit RsxC [Actinomycetota bacterium]